MSEIWTPVPGCTRYSVSNTGFVTNNDTGRVLSTSLTKQGAVKVGLYSDYGDRITQSVKVLVAEAYCKRFNQYCDTAMVKDGDQENLTAENIVWRPRWFAIQYAQEFNCDSDLMALYTKQPVFDVDDLDEYEHIWAASRAYGLLATEVHHTVVTPNTYAWPEHKRFAYGG